MPKNIDEAGVILSGGQLQSKVSAKSFYFNERLLAHGKTVNALDVAIKALVIDCFKILRGDVTVISNTHR